MGTAIKTMPTGWALLRNGREVFRASTMLALIEYLLQIQPMTVYEVTTRAGYSIQPLREACGQGVHHK
jgi:hypothetical protein